MGPVFVTFYIDLLSIMSNRTLLVPLIIYIRSEADQVSQRLYNTGQSLEIE